MAKKYYHCRYDLPPWVGERWKDEAERRAKIEGSYPVKRLLIDIAKTMLPSAKEGRSIPPGPSSEPPAPALVPKNEQPQPRAKSPRRAKRSRKAPPEEPQEGVA